MSEKSSKHWYHGELKQFICILLIIALFLCIANGVKSHRESDCISVREYASSDVTYIDGTTAHSDSNYFGSVSKGDVAVVHVRLPEELKISDSALCFAIYHSVVEVFWGDKLLYSRGREAYEQGDMIGNNHFAVAIPDEAWGSELTIRLLPTENDAFARIKTLKVYPKITASNYFVDADPIGFFVSIPLLVISLLVLILISILGRRNPLFYKGVCLSLFILFVALWICVSDGFQHLIGYHGEGWACLEFIAVFAVSYPLLLYVALSLPQGRQRKIYIGIFGIDLVFFVIATVLNFTNVIHYCALLQCAHVFTGINAGIVLAFSLRMHKSDRYSMRILYDGMIILVLCTLVELLRTNVPFLEKCNIPSIVHLGLAALIICLIISYVNEIIEVKQTAEDLRQELDKSRIKAMIAQMQPHFLYNALSSIRAMIKIEPNYAYDLMHDFTVHLRCSIQALSSDSPIPFKDELKNVKAYLNIEYMRFGDRLKVDYEIGCDDFKIIPLAVQPLVENSVKHGIHPKGEEGGRVVLRTSQTDTHYIIEVEDDGVGFNVAEVMHYTGDSVGLRNLIFRMKSLMNSDVVIDSKLNEGTRVTIKIPKKERRT
ncbi:MAG: histidine kinase [Bacillota bacterium]|nr:histidine kinase [Bacillota bacterium]